MSKAAQIKELYAQGLGSAEIAAIVGCKQEYCRVAGRQRNVPGGYSAADKRYIAKDPDKRLAYFRAYSAKRYLTVVKPWRQTPEGRERHRAACRKYQASKKQKSPQPPVG